MAQTKKDSDRKLITCLTWIKQRIDNQTYPDGTWLPQVHEMCSLSESGMPAMRQALTELGRQQIITNVHRVGWYAGNGQQPQEPSPAEIKRHRLDSRKPDAPKMPDQLLNQEPFVTVTELSALLRVNRATIYRLIHSGEIHNVNRRGPSMRIPVSGAAKFLQHAKTPDTRSHAETADEKQHPGNQGAGQPAGTRPPATAAPPATPADARPGQ